MAFKKTTDVAIYDLQSDLATVKADIGQLALAIDVGKFFEYNGATWMPFSTTNVIKSTVSVNGKATGATKVATTPNTTLKFYPFLAVIRAVNISGVTTPPTLSIGTNSTSYNNIVTGALLATLLSTLSAGSGAPQMATVSTPIVGNTDIYANITIAGIATNYTFNVEIIGFYDV